MTIPALMPNALSITESTGINALLVQDPAEITDISGVSKLWFRPQIMVLSTSILAGCESSTLLTPLPRCVEAEARVNSVPVQSITMSTP